MQGEGCGSGSTLLDLGGAINFASKLSLQLIISNTHTQFAECDNISLKSVRNKSTRVALDGFQWLRQSDSNVVWLASQLNDSTREKNCFDHHFTSQKGELVMNIQ